MNPQAIAATIIHKVIFQQHSLNDVLEAHKHEKNAALIQELSYGSIRWYFQLKTIANQLLHSPLPAKHNNISCVLIVGLYQLLYTRVPTYAAISETVEATKLLKKNWASGLLNKILRLFVERKEVLVSSFEENVIEQFSHPVWLTKKIQQAWPQQWQKILYENNQKPPFFIRVNSQKTSRDHYLTLLKEQDIAAHAINDLPNAIQIINPIPVDKLPGFFEGFCSIQDIAGQNVCELLDLKADFRVLDACAAPGSKTSHILEAQPNIMKLAAIDIDPIRLQKIKQNIDRLQLNHHNMHLILADASHVKQWWDGKLFDRILIDAPCSGTGVIRRHPDIKVLRQESDISQYVKQQLMLLTNLWPLLAKNGKLIYTTCSILPQENAGVIQQFSKQHDCTIDFSEQLFPTQNGSDGFYYAVISRS